MPDQNYTRNLSDTLRPDVFTWYDLLTDLMDNGGITLAGADDRKLRGACLDAYRDVARREWKFLLGHRMLQTTAAVTATGSYDHTGGASERLVTLTSGVFTQSVFNDVTLIIDGLPYQPDQFLTTTTCTLAPHNNPGADVASGTIKIVRNIYAAPGDFLRPFAPQAESEHEGIGWVSPEAMLAMEMRSQHYGNVSAAAVMAHPKFIGQKCLRVWPYPTTVEQISLLYTRLCRPLVYSGYQSGHYGTFTLDIGTDANRATMVSGITVSRKMIGSMFRLRSDTEYPEGREGQYPFEEQAMIIDVNVGSSFVYLDRDLEASYTAKACRISDPVDMPEYMIMALKAGARYYYALNSAKSSKDVQMAKAVYFDELIQAKESDQSYVPSADAGHDWHFQDDSEMTRTWYT